MGSTFLENFQQQKIHKWGSECSKPLMACHKIFGFPGKVAWKKMQRYSHQMVFFHGGSGPPSNSIHLPCSSWTPSVAHYQIVIIHYYQVTKHMRPSCNTKWKWTQQDSMLRLIKKHWKPKSLRHRLQSTNRSQKHTSHAWDAWSGIQLPRLHRPSKDSRHGSSLDPWCEGFVRAITSPATILATWSFGSSCGTHPASALRMADTLSQNITHTIQVWYIYPHSQFGWFLW